MIVWCFAAGRLAGVALVDIVEWIIEPLIDCLDDEYRAEGREP